MPDLGRKSHSSAWDEDAARGIAAGMKGMAGPLLPILHALNEHFGYVDERAVPVLADVLNLSRAEVHGVVTFYHDFREAPAGRVTVRVCRAEACQAVGALALIERICARRGVKLGETTIDGSVTIEPVYCLGNCALGPAALVDGALHGRLDVARLDALIDMRLREAAQ